ncbi:glycosyltransferase 1 domain-containing protein 1 isoform X4 [Oncorhynchus tshawytscha]|uniref:glycosyltransferase 1 domain-containing protein 1 isoform X4 n=1 Tax=Oncorhynchus tshawytscha TaxID=74940 RepID=UPI001C3D931A|nr:glycosyltransferase 1 domain-containing protein 1 isoform X4 [Oncorhynchus tshawytscha]
MKLLFLACLSPKTGNCTTAERIRAHIESAGHTCELRDAADFKSSAEVASLIEQKPPFEGAIAIHLFKGGRLLLGEATVPSENTQVPFGVVFGGTDINEDVKVEQKRAVMEQVLLKARFAVAFTDKLKAEAEVFLLSQSSKIYVQPQGIKTEAAQSFCWSEFLRRSGVSGEDVEDLHVFLLVCGLRRVKDPLYLLEAFSEWHTENPLVVLIIIGPKSSQPTVLLQCRRWTSPSTKTSAGLVWATQGFPPCQVYGHTPLGPVSWRAAWDQATDVSLSVTYCVLAEGSG